MHLFCLWSGLDAVKPSLNFVWSHSKQQLLSCCITEHESLRPVSIPFPAYHPGEWCRIANLNKSASRRSSISSKKHKATEQAPTLVRLNDSGRGNLAFQTPSSICGSVQKYFYASPPPHVALLHFTNSKDMIRLALGYQVTRSHGTHCPTLLLT